MKLIRTVLCIGIAVLFMAVFFRPGCRVILCGSAMPGVYTPAAVYRCAESAQQAAAEITRSSSPSPFTIVPVLCLQPEDPDEALMTRVLLEAYDGVSKLYAVTVDGVSVGLVEEIGDVIALQQMYPHRSVRFTQTYSYSGAASSLQEVQTVMSRMDSQSVEF